ncbi:Protein RER1A [Bienertia sinuspersici]
MMEAGGGSSSSGAGGGSGGVAESLSSETPASAASRLSFMLSRRYQYYLDKSTPHILYRWIAFFIIAFSYALRVYIVQGFYIVSYGLGIYILNLLIAFLSPQVDPEIQELTDGPTLPTRGSDEFRPFVRRLPEFKFCGMTEGSLLLMKALQLLGIDVSG